MEATGNQTSLSPGLTRRAALYALLCAPAGCGRFANRESSSATQRIVCIGQAYNEIIFAIGAQANLAGVDYSSTFPAEIRKLPTVGYHRALSAEGILSLHPTLVLHDNNIGPDHVVRQLVDLKVPMKTFAAKNDSVDGTRALISEMGAFFHREQSAAEVSAKLGRDMAASQKLVKDYRDRPRVEVIHFGRASNIYLVVGNGGGGDAAAAAQIVQQAGGRMAIEKPGMQRLTSPELVAQSDPDLILMTEFGFDRLGSIDQARTLPGVAETKAAKTNRIYRISEHELMYFGPDTGQNVMKLARLIHGS